MEETNEAVVEEIAAPENTEPSELEKIKLENAELKMKLQIMEQNEINRARSTGARHTECQQKPYDPFDDVWE